MMTLYEIISIILSLVAIGVAVVAVVKSTKVSRRQEKMMNSRQLQEAEAELTRLQVEYKRVQNEHRNKKQNDRPNVYAIEVVMEWEKNLDASYSAIYADFENRIAILKQKISELKAK